MLGESVPMYKKKVDGYLLLLYPMLDAVLGMPSLLDRLGVDVEADPARDSRQEGFCIKNMYM